MSTFQNFYKIHLLYSLGQLKGSQPPIKVTCTYNYYMRSIKKNSLKIRGGGLTPPDFSTANSGGVATPPHFGAPAESVIHRL